MPDTPDPTRVHPTTRPDLTNVAFLSTVVRSPLIEVGEYTYYDDPVSAAEFETRNVLYNYGPAKLRIGRFCALATGARFIMPAANHPMIGCSTYPFTIFGGDWTEATADIAAGLPGKGDTVVGNDVWIGRDTTVMPGVHIGDGAIIATAAVVTGDIPAYGIAGGNPARVIHRRFYDADVELLQRIAWWNWPIQAITEHVRTIMGGQPKELAALARREGLLDA